MPKRTTAVETVRTMNPAMNAIAHQNRLGPDSVSTYYDKFLKALVGVSNALENMDISMLLLP